VVRTSLRSRNRETSVLRSPGARREKDVINQHLISPHRSLLVRLPSASIIPAKDVGTPAVHEEQSRNASTLLFSKQAYPYPRLLPETLLTPFRLQSLIVPTDHFKM
jgi:hypothetical protein